MIKKTLNKNLFWTLEDSLFWYQNHLRVPVLPGINPESELNEELALQSIKNAYLWFEKQKKYLPEIVEEIENIDFWNSIKDKSEVKINEYQNGFKIRTEPIIPLFEARIYLHKNISDKIKSILSPKLDIYKIKKESQEFYEILLHWYTKDLLGSDKLIAFNTVMNYNNLILKR